MQRGFATLEIILAVMIIAVLTKVTVPNAARIIDRAALDYETKRLYSELRFIQSMSRSSTILNTGTGGTGIIKGDLQKPTLIITNAKNGYQVCRGSGTGRTAIREPHYFANGEKISFKTSVYQNTITFNELGNATTVENKALTNTLILTKQLDKKNRIENYIIFDSVGRIRSSLTGN